MPSHEKAAGAKFENLQPTSSGLAAAKLPGARRELLRLRREVCGRFQTMLLASRAGNDRRSYSLGVGKVKNLSSAQKWQTSIKKQQVEVQHYNV